jgi:3-hydroxyisobutyrate dehydrogenase
MNVGIAGTGRMGAAIAQRLLGLGHTVRVWNRTREKTAALETQGAIVCANPADVTAGSEAVITMLTDAAAIERVYAGSDGLLAGEVQGRTFIEMSTVRPETERALAARIRARGGALIECPVGGTVGPAREGKLLGIVGGAREDVERMRPLLDGLCRRWEHLGPVGAGASGKLAINLPLMVFWQAFGEALALVQHLGIDCARLVDSSPIPRAARTCSRPAARRSPRKWPAATRARSRSTSTRCARTCTRCSTKAGRSVTPCRWHRRRSPASNG